MTKKQELGYTDLKYLQHGINYYTFHKMKPYLPTKAMMMGSLVHYYIQHSDIYRHLGKFIEDNPQAEQLLLRKRPAEKDIGSSEAGMCCRRAAEEAICKSLSILGHPMLACCRHGDEYRTTHESVLLLDDELFVKRASPDARNFDPKTGVVNIIDYKTHAGSMMTTEEIARKIHAFDYDLQAYYYTSVVLDFYNRLRLLGCTEGVGKEIQGLFKICFISMRDKPIVQLVSLGPDWMASGKAKYDKAMAVMKEFCQRFSQKTFPDFSDNCVFSFEDLGFLPAPKWLAKSMEQPIEQVEIPDEEFFGEEDLS